MLNIEMRCLWMFWITEKGTICLACSSFFVLLSNYALINITLFFIWCKAYIFNRFEISWILLSYWIGVSVGKLRNSFQYVQFVAGCMLSFHTKIDFVPIPRFYPLYGIAELYICLGFYSVRFSQILWNLW